MKFYTPRVYRVFQFYASVHLKTAKRLKIIFNYISIHSGRQHALNNRVWTKIYNEIRKKPATFLNAFQNNYKFELMNENDIFTSES